MKRWVTVAVAALLVAAGSAVGFLLLRDGKPAGHAEITILASRDTYVSEAKPDDSYGDARQLRVDGQPSVVRSYLHFDLPTGNPRVYGMRLLLHANTADNAGLLISPVPTMSWTEASTWRTAPPVEAPAVQTVPVDADAWVDADLNALMRQPLPTGLDLALVSTGQTMVSYSSREDGDQKAPRLVLRMERAEPRG